MAQEEKDKGASEAREIPIEDAPKTSKQETCEACAPAKEASAGGPEEAASEAPQAPQEAPQEEGGGQSASEEEQVASEADAVVAEAERVAKAEQEVAAMRDKYLRLQAEWDNFRKRTAEQAADMRTRAAERLMGDVLPVLDDFERAITHAEGNGESGLLEGVKAIDAKLNEVFAKHGLEVIDPAGKAFDAFEHQAVSTVEDANVPDETVAQVYQKGYRLGKKVLRPAVVAISTGGPKRTSGESEDAGEEQ